MKDKSIYLHSVRTPHSWARLRCAKSKLTKSDQVFGGKLRLQDPQQRMPTLSTWLPVGAGRDSAGGGQSAPIKTQPHLHLSFEGEGGAMNSS